MKLGLELPAPVRQYIGQAWAGRTHVEEISSVQFERLAAALRTLGAPAKLGEVASRAAGEEAQHRALCADLAHAYGVDPGPPAAAEPLAPAGLPVFEACLYTAVAHCCVAETESMATLTELVREAGPPEVRSALVSIARDEVQHAQLGWAIVTWAARERSLSFLAPFLPAMLEPGAAPLFDVTPGSADDPRLLLHGVLPARRKREVFTETFLEVLLPGLERVGIDSARARRWLELLAR